MAKKINYADMFTLRKDGRYVGTYLENGKRKYVYDRDPESLFHRIAQLQKSPPPKVRTFRDVAQEWEREHREKIEVRTWKNYEPHYQEILSTVGNLPFEEVLGNDVDAHLKRAKARNYSRTVVNSIRSIYSMIFDFGVVKGYTRYNPALSVKLPKGLQQGKRTAPTDEQIRTILTSLDKPFGLFPFLLLCTGMRKSEALALTWNDVDFDHNKIYVNKSLDTTNGAHPKIKPPKTEAGNREITMVDILVEPLRAARRASKSSLVFPCPPSNRAGEGGGFVTDRAYDGLWMRYCEATGMVTDGKPDISAHQLRHGTATLMFESGVDEKTAQRTLGHSRIEITREIYTDLREKQLALSMTKLSEKFDDILSQNLSNSSSH